MKLGVLAGETSGDILGAALLTEWCRRHPHTQLSGIGGPLMTECGLESLYPMDRLAVMGLVEPLKRLPELLKIRRDVFEQQRLWPADVFLGIDSPDFNLTLERKLRESGVKTAHLVSPSVWAWRSGRIHKIARSVDLMLCLLPFELEIYQRAGIPAVCVGHPMLEEAERLPDQSAARTLLGLAPDANYLAVLPGSRSGEVAHLLPLFLSTVDILRQRDPDLKVVIPAANEARHTQIVGLLNGRDDIEVTLQSGRLAMIAADNVLLASGTAALEAMFLRRPMVIAYRMAWLSWQILSRMATTKFVGLPNILAGRELVPELLQDAATPEALADTMSAVMEHGKRIQVPAFEHIAESIGPGFANRCVDALDGLVARS